MSKDECMHGLSRASCAFCGVRVPTGSALKPAGPANNRSKQRLLDDLCDVLGVARFAAVPGATPARVFDAAAVRAKVKPGPMPTVAAAIVAKAGLDWGPQCDNRRHHHTATMVTREGLVVLTQALVALARR